MALKQSDFPVRHGNFAAQIKIGLPAVYATSLAMEFENKVLCKMLKETACCEMIKQAKK